ncbi:MAG TPA: cellulose synthase [Streptosporangiaceae bacterium]|jgi:hypothetical protein
MSTYDKIWWLPICGGLTGLGLVLSYLTMRRRGLGSGLRGAAWSLLPIAAYLTGSIEMFWKMGVAIGDFAKGFVFSPKVWSGIAVAGLAVVLFVVSGPLRARRQVKSGGRAARSATAQNPSTALAPAAGPGAGALATTTAPADPLPQRAKAPKAAKGKNNNSDDDAMGSDVEDILRRHGIS